MKHDIIYKVDLQIYLKQIFTMIVLLIITF
jgi:hypothetical protein